MSSFLENFVNISVFAGVFTLAILGMRIIFKRAPKSLFMILWALLALRLLCPLTINTQFGLMPDKVIEKEVVEKRAAKTVVRVLPSHTQGSVRLQKDEVKKHVDPYKIVCVIWLSGAAVFISAGAVSYIRLKRRTNAKIKISDNVYVCDDVNSAFIIGMIRPKIIIPSGLSTSDLKHVLRHENMHIKHRDNIWKPLGYLLLSFNWFNPLLWLAFVYFCKDMELYCDECVIRDYSKEQTADYSSTLLKLSSSKNPIATLAFGEVGIGYRIRSIAKYKEPAIALILVCVIAMGILSACFLTNKSKKQGVSSVGPANPEKTEPVETDKVQDLQNDTEFLTALATEVLEDTYANYPAEVSIKFEEVSEDDMGEYANFLVKNKNDFNEFSYSGQVYFNEKHDITFGPYLEFYGTGMDTTDGFVNLYFKTKDMDAPEDLSSETVVVDVEYTKDESLITDDCMGKIVRMFENDEGVENDTYVYTKLGYEKEYLDDGTPVYYYLLLVCEEGKDPYLEAGALSASDKSSYIDESYTFADPSVVIDYFKSNGMGDETDPENYDILLAFLRNWDSVNECNEIAENDNYSYIYMFYANNPDEGETEEG